MREIKWEIMSGQFSNGYNCFLGKWNVASTQYNVIDRDDNLRYIASCRLPGIKPILGKFPTEEQAREKIIIAVTHWVNEIL